MSEKHKVHAEKCANAINQYWRAQGFDANAYVTERKVTKKGAVYDIRSDLINGLPPAAKSVSVARHSIVENSRRICESVGIDTSGWGEGRGRR